MHAIYHCVPAKTLRPTDDLNVFLIFYIFRLELALGERKILRKKEKGNSFSVLIIKTKEMSGFLV